MDVAIVSALVGAGGSLAVALIGLLRSGAADRKADEVQKRAEAQEVRLEELKRRLDEELELARRTLDAHQIFDRYREPLADAAFDLQHRLGNIIDGHFLSAYIEDDDRKDLAINSTLFRVAQYFGWREALRRSVQYYQFHEARELREISDTLGKISREWATDRNGSHLMIWHESQRAVGELMLEPGQDELPTVIGFAKFSDRIGDFLPWLVAVEGSVRDQSAQQSPRLAELKRYVVELVRQLDPESVRFSDEDLGLVNETGDGPH